MKRLELLEKARQRAWDVVIMSSCLPDAEHKKLSKLPDDDAIEEKAKEILRNTSDEIEAGCC